MRRSERGPLVILAAVLLGLLAVVVASTGSPVPFALVFALAFLLIGANHPPLAVLGCFVAIFVDLGLPGVRLGVPITVGKMAVALAIVSWLVHAAFSRQPLLRRNVLTVPIAAMFLSMIASLIDAPLLSETWLSLASFVLTMTMLHFVSSALRTEAVVRVLAWVGWIAVPGFLFALFAVDPVAGRAVGAAGDANEFAATLLLVGPLALGGLVNRRDHLSVLCRRILVILIPLGVLWSMSRSGLIVMLLVTPVILYLLRRELFYALGGAGVAIGLVVLLSDKEQIWARLLALVGFESTGGGYGSIAMRETALRTGLELWRDHPLFGAGLGSFEHYMGLDAAGKTLAGAHNHYITVAAEQGTVGLLIFIWAGLVVFSALVFAIRNARTTLDRDLAVGALGAGLAYYGASLFLEMLTFPLPYFLAGVGLVVHRRVLESLDAPDARGPGAGEPSGDAPAVGAALQAAGE